MIAASGHGWGLALFPLAAAVVAAVFGAMLLQRFARRKRAYEGVWAIALFMFAVASAAMFFGVVRGWRPADFKIYWLFGAILNVPYLAQGELYLLVKPRRWTNLLGFALLVGTAFATWKVTRAPLNEAALAKSLPLGRDVFGDNTAPYRLSQLYAYPAYFLLVGGSAWSWVRMRGRPDLRDRMTGTALIAFGATIVAIGSGVGAGFDIVPLFSVALALGIAVMFGGFLRASRRSRQA
jgi:MFS family permease